MRPKAFSTQSQGRPQFTRAMLRQFRKQLRNDPQRRARLRTAFGKAVQWKSPMAPQRPPYLAAAIENALFEVMLEHGPSAFRMTRESAIAHEAGHAIAAAAEGLPVTSVSVFIVPDSDDWVGATDHGVTMTVGPATDPLSDLRQARVTIAGFVGEYISGTHRPASALDEIFDATEFARIAADKLKRDRVALWEADVYRRTLTILRANHAAFNKLRAVLDATETVEGDALQQILAQVEVAS